MREGLAIHRSTRNSIPIHNDLPPIDYDKLYSWLTEWYLDSTTPVLPSISKPNKQLEKLQNTREPIQYFERVHNDEYSGNRRVADFVTEGGYKMKEGNEREHIRGSCDGFIQHARWSDGGSDRVKVKVGNITKKLVHTIRSW